MSVQDRIRTAAWSKLAYHDPVADLLALRAIEVDTAQWPLDPQVRTLRTGKQKPYCEWRQAALFCCGMSQAILRCPIHFAPAESSDHDFIARWQADDMQSFAPVQLKELVPAALNPEADINAVLSGLKKYSDSADTVVAVYVNRRVRLALDAIVVPALRVAEVWLFGALSEDARRWFLIGDLLREKAFHEFTYPT